MTPRVRVVVLDHNGGELTLDCLRRLAKTDWPAAALELVLVDNASTDTVVDRVRDELPQVRVIESPINLGFAGGCNLALRDLGEVDHVALVNNDLLVEPDWLRPLVDTLEADPGLGAACPKILFASPMVDVTVTVPDTTRRGRGDRRELGVRLSGVRVDGEDRTALTRFVDGFWGPEHGGEDEPQYQWTAREALLRVPVSVGGADTRACELRLSADRPKDVAIVSGAATKTHTVGREPAWYPIRLAGEPGDVINNVGSLLTDDWYGADRGYLERDHGQYDEAEDVTAWCGGAVLLRRSYLDDAGLFDDRLFLYYEDLELSLRGREQGWRYRYVPSSVVRHVHSATSVEGSALADHYNERNRLLVLARHAPRSVVTRAIVRYLLVTASYARRDFVSPRLRGEPARGEAVRRRLHALASFLPRAPAMASDRGRQHATTGTGRRRRVRAVRMSRLTEARLLATVFVPKGRRLAPAFVGRVERPAERRVVGHTGRVCWVAGWVLAKTGRPVRVVARVDGDPVVETVADDPRPDVVDRLARRLPVNPLCGFSFYVDLPPLGGEPVTLTLEFSDGENVSRRQRFVLAPDPELMKLDTYEGMSRAKDALARRHLRGEGVELGALHQPLPCDWEQCTVRYVDRLTREGAIAAYPELRAHAHEIVEPDFVIDLATENLSALRADAFDFFIANDVIEHVPNPIKLLRDTYDVMKPGALLFLSAPDRDFTFDIRRRLTTHRHLWREYKRGVSVADAGHLRDFVRGTAPQVYSWSPADRDDYLEGQYRRSFHVHVWDQASFDEFLDWATRRLDLRWQVIDRVRSRDARGSMVYVLRRDDA